MFLHEVLGKDKERVEELAYNIHRKGGSLYIVGGATRDYFLNRKVDEVDMVVVGLSVEDVEEVLGSPERVGKSFPVYLWKGYEIAMARTERSTGPGHKDYEVSFGEHVSLEEDAMRRDFTINALYYDVYRKSLEDPIKIGKSSLTSLWLEQVGDHFSDDPLRVFRAARFMAEIPNLTASHLLEDACREVSEKGLLKSLPAERVAQETEKAFVAENPRAYFEFLMEVNAMKDWFPEIEGLFKVEDRHNGTTGNHILEMLNKGIETELGWSVLVHDIGKLATPKEEYPKHYGHENEKQMAEEFLERFKLSNDKVSKALSGQKYHMLAHNVDKLRPGTVYDMFDSLTYEEVGNLVKLHALDSRSSDRKDKANRILELYSSYQHVCTKITGHDVLDKHTDISGPSVGSLLRQWRINLFKKHF